ncbi:hypothetical protein [Archangium lipolyticum]|uniref:hypothetical protein n=1 Tax=Archangium lipolyticum TaxID=2970465 RepID=UPI00214A252C|nr:hypothetical protein [Archangium lipolyticum]
MNPVLIQSTLVLLHGVERFASTSEQHDALENSRIALHFILERNEAIEFEEYLEGFNTARLTPALSFVTKEEAEAWLRVHPAPPHGAIIGVGDSLYHVAYSRELEHRKLLRLASKEEWARMAGAEEEEEEEPSTPNPGRGARFSLFDLCNKTCLHLHEMEQRMSSPEELEAIRIAKIAFHFVMDIGEHHGFEEFLGTLHSTRVSRPVRSFATREEAYSWLETQPSPPPPAVVAIGSELYSVGFNRRKGLRVLIRIPTRRELDIGSP